MTDPTQTSRFWFTRRQLLRAFLRGGLVINLTFPADHHLEYHYDTSWPVPDTPRLKEVKRYG